MNSAGRVHAAIVCGALLALAALTLGGCGQKGPLYLPDHNGSVVPVTPASITTSPDTHKDTDKDTDKPARRAP